MAQNYAPWGWSGSTYSERVYLSVVYTSNSITSNTTTFTYRVWNNSNNSYGDTGNIDWRISDPWSSSRVSGSRASTPTTGYNQVRDYASGTFTISNNSDGSFPNTTFTLHISRGAGNTRSATVRVTVSGIPTIPRASRLTSTSATTLEKGVEIRYESYSSSFTHEIQVKSSISNVIYATRTTTNTNKYSLTFTTSELNTIYNANPGNQSIRVTIVLRTKSGNSQVGSISDINTSIGVMTATSSGPTSFNIMTSTTMSWTLSSTSPSSAVTHRVGLFDGQTQVFLSSEGATSHSITDAVAESIITRMTNSNSKEFTLRTYTYTGGSSVGFSSRSISCTLSYSPAVTVSNSALTDVSSDSKSVPVTVSRLRSNAITYRVSAYMILGGDTTNRGTVLSSTVVSSNSSSYTLSNLIKHQSSGMEYNVRFLVTVTNGTASVGSGVTTVPTSLSSSVKVALTSSSISVINGLSKYDSKDIYVTNISKVQVEYEYSLPQGTVLSLVSIDLYNTDGSHYANVYTRGVAFNTIHLDISGWVTTKVTKEVRLTLTDNLGGTASYGKLIHIRPWSLPSGSVYSLRVTPPVQSSGRPPESPSSTTVFISATPVVSYVEDTDGVNLNPIEIQVYQGSTLVSKMDPVVLQRGDPIPELRSTLSGTYSSSIDYTFTFKFIDELGSITIDTTVENELLPIVIGDDNVGIGKIPDEGKSLDVKGLAYHDGGKRLVDEVRLESGDLVKVAASVIEGNNITSSGGMSAEGPVTSMSSVSSRELWITDQNNNLVYEVGSTKNNDISMDIQTWRYPEYYLQNYPGRVVIETLGVGDSELPGLTQGYVYVQTLVPAAAKWLDLEVVQVVYHYGSGSEPPRIFTRKSIPPGSWSPEGSWSPWATVATFVGAYG